MQNIMLICILKKKNNIFKQNKSQEKKIINRIILLCVLSLLEIADRNIYY